VNSGAAKRRNRRTIWLVIVDPGNAVRAVHEIDGVHAVNANEKNMFDFRIMGLSLDCSGAQQGRNRKQGVQTTLYHGMNPP
jgi:hypothetical protein